MAAFDPRASSSERGKCSPAPAIIDSFLFLSIGDCLRLYELITEGTDEASLWYHLYITMEEALIGFLFGSVFGVLFGVALGRNKMASDVLSVYIKV